MGNNNRNNHFNNGNNYNQNQNNNNNNNQWNNGNNHNQNQNNGVNNNNNNGLHQKIISIIRGSDNEAGCHKQTILNHNGLSTQSLTEIQTAMDELKGNDTIYTTVDDDHFGVIDD